MLVMEATLPSLISEEDLRGMEHVALHQAPKVGCMMEVGVYQGGSASVLYRICENQGRQLYLYDTFTGIPYKDEVDSHCIGDFAQDSRAPEELSKKLPKAMVVVGVFPQSAQKEMRDIAFAHLDCDQYQSYVDAIKYLKPLMVPGGIMYFDDYDCLVGATKAVNELIGKEHLAWVGEWVDESFVGKAFYRCP